MTKGSDLLVAALENEGVDRIFGVPGEENLDVVESLRGSGIGLVLTRTESAVTRHGLLNSKIAAPLRSTMSHDHHPPERPRHARRGGDPAPAPGAERNIGHLRRRRRPPITLSRLIFPAQPNS